VAAGARSGLLPTFVGETRHVSAGTTSRACHGGRALYQSRVPFSDNAYTGDYDLDAQVLYTVSSQPSGKIQVYVCVHKQGYDRPPTDVNRVANNPADYAYAVTGGLMHIGYAISGTTEDSARLVVRNPQYKSDTCSWTSANQVYDIQHALDFWDGVLDRSKLTFIEDYYCGNEGTLKGDLRYNNSLPFYHTWTYTPSATTAANYIEHDPLWYAAKWGGFVDGYDKTTGRVVETAKNNKLDNG